MNPKRSLPAVMCMQSSNHQVQPVTQPHYQFHIIWAPEVLPNFGALFLQPHSCSVCDSSNPSIPGLRCGGRTGQNKVSFPAPIFPKLGEYHLGGSLVQQHCHVWGEGRRAVPSTQNGKQRWDPTWSTMTCLSFSCSFPLSPFQARCQLWGRWGHAQPGCRHWPGRFPQDTLRPSKFLSLPAYKPMTWAIVLPFPSEMLLVSHLSSSTGQGMPCTQQVAVALCFPLCWGVFETVF